MAKNPPRFSELTEKAPGPEAPGNPYAWGDPQSESERLFAQQAGHGHYAGLNILSPTEAQKLEEERKSDEKASAAYRALNAQIASLNEDIERLTKELEAIEEELAQEEKKLHACKEKCHHLIEKVEEKQKLNEKLEKKDEKISKQIRVEEAEYKQHSKQLKKAETALEEAQKNPSTDIFTGKKIARDQTGIFKINEHGEKDYCGKLETGCHKLCEFLGLEKINPDTTPLKEEVEASRDKYEHSKMQVESSKEARREVRNTIENNNKAISQDVSKISSTQEEAKQSEQKIGTLRIKKESTEHLLEETTEKRDDLQQKENPDLKVNFNNKSGVFDTTTAEQIVRNEGVDSLGLNRDNDYADMEAKILNRIENGAIASTELKNLLSDSSAALRSKIEHMLDHRGVEIKEPKWGIGSYQRIANVGPNVPVAEQHMNELNPNPALAPSIQETFSLAAQEITAKPKAPEPVEPRHGSNMTLGA